MTNEHYYTESPKSKLVVKKLKEKLRNREIEFFTASGLFSFNRLDRGTELLINKCLVEDKQKILDLGCGYGIIGLSLKLINPALDVTFSDINNRAIEITRKNLILHKLKAEVIHSGDFNNINNNNFDVILLNPPQTAGKNVCFKLIEDSKKYLNNNGSLQIVARHNKGGKELAKKMLEVFDNVNDIAKSSGYRIYISFKKA